MSYEKPKLLVLSLNAADMIHSIFDFDTSNTTKHSSTFEAGLGGGTDTKNNSNNDGPLATSSTPGAYEADE